MSIVMERIMEGSKPRVWCSQQEYPSPQDGISMSVNSGSPALKINEECAVVAFRGTNAGEDNNGFVLEPAKVLIRDAECQSSVWKGQSNEEKRVSRLLLQKLDERKRVYIDQQIPSVLPLNIYYGQDPRAKPQSPGLWDVGTLWE